VAPGTGLTLPNRTEVLVTFRPRGAARDIFANRADELLIAGPAGTGKSRACLEKLHLAALNHPGMRGLIFRKTQRSLTSSALVTFRERVLHPLDRVRFFGGNEEKPAQYEYPNGSVLVVGGMDNPEKVMSTDYDMAYGNEMTDCELVDLEAVTTRLRNGKMPYQQLLMDCNPAGPQHWLKQRVDQGKVTMLESRHEDNPLFFDDAGAITEAGRAYMSKLDALTGVRYLRLRLGHWAASEGMIYDGFDPSVHVIDRYPIPEHWTRYWCVDFGYTNPFCWQAWAEDPDGRLIMYREIYHTQRIVQDHASHIRAATMGDPRPRAIICDHDAEDRATLTRELGMPTLPATKAVEGGIQAVMSRLRKAGDLKPRLYLMRDALVERDQALADALLPTCTEEEFPSYVWDDNYRKGEHPVKKYDHGMDCMRYMVAAIDRIPEYTPAIARPVYKTDPHPVMRSGSQRKAGRSVRGGAI
jgi:PBSX family phage terminase large subunit